MALVALAALVAAVCVLRLRRSSPELPPAASKAGAISPSSPPPPARALDAAAAWAAEKGLPPVYLRIDGVRLLRPAPPHARARVRANVNGSYYGYPSPSDDGGVRWLELDANTSAEHFAITRSYYYEVYFELELQGAGTLSGASSTLDLSSPSGTASDKLPFHAEYDLYLAGHGMRAARPSAILSYAITETP